jgi:hypothetical protein
MSNDILLIGPIGAGKSAQGGLRAEKPGLPRAEMDSLRFAFTRHRSNHDPAKVVGYIKDRTLEQTRDEILRRISASTESE